MWNEMKTFFVFWYISQKIHVFFPFEDLILFRNDEIILFTGWNDVSREERSLLHLSSGFCCSSVFALLTLISETENLT